MNAPLILPTILTAGGRYFPLLAPSPADIHIEDIAHALSNLCRFTGHVREFYSVAQHSALVSQIVPPEDALAGLLHDASEAYTNDISKPCKPLLRGLAEIETRIMEVVLATFGLPTCLPDSVKRADLILLATEKRDLMPPHEDWELTRDLPRLQEEIVPLPPRAARARFLDRFHQLRRSLA